MDSLLFLSARRLLSHRPTAQRALDLLPPHLYPILFQAAFQDGRVLVLQDLVATWPFPLLSFREIWGSNQPLLQHINTKLCLQALISTLVEQLQKQREENSQTSESPSRFRLRFLDLTALQEAPSPFPPSPFHPSPPQPPPDSITLWSTTVALAKACLELSKHPTQRRPPKRHKGPTLPLPHPLPLPPPTHVDIHADLFVNATSFIILRDALRASSSSSSSSTLRLRCRHFRAEELSPGGTITLLESLEPSHLLRVDLRFNNLGLPGLASVLPHLTRFPQLLSLRLPYSNVDVRRWAPPGCSELGIQCLADNLANLPLLKELNLDSSRLSGKLRQLLGNLNSPLEILELAFSSLLPDDLHFLSQSFHPPALKKLDLSGHHFTQNHLQPLANLLEKSSFSLLHLDLMECHLTDSNLEFLLTPLSLCSRLRALGLSGNPLTLQGLKTLVRKTLPLPHLHLVLYPYPLESAHQDHPQGSRDHQEDLDQDQLTDVAREVQEMLEASGRANTLWTTNISLYGNTDYLTPHCSQNLDFPPQSGALLP